MWCSSVRGAVRTLALGLALAAAPAAASPDVQQWTTDNGARVLFVSAPEIPVVDARVTFDAGSARDGDHAAVDRPPSFIRSR